MSLPSVYSHILVSVQNRLFLSHLANWILHVASDDYEVEIGCQFHRDTSGGTREPKAGIFQSPAIDSGSLLVHVNGVASSGRKRFPNVASPKTYGRSGLTLRRVLARESVDTDGAIQNVWRVRYCPDTSRQRTMVSQDPVVLASRFVFFPGEETCSAAAALYEVPDVGTCGVDVR